MVVTPDMTPSCPALHEKPLRMPKSTKRTRRDKPAKPSPDFPHFPHATGRWAKKIRGKLHYFGPWENPHEALDKYVEQRDDLHAGRQPRKGGGGPTIRDLVNRFLTAKTHLVDAGELSQRLP